MREDQRSFTIARVPPPIGDPRPVSELEHLRATCRRQTMMIDSLSGAVSALSSGARALKAENAELRAEAARLLAESRSEELV